MNAPILPEIYASWAARAGVRTMASNWNTMRPRDQAGIGAVVPEVSRFIALARVGIGKAKYVLW